MLSCYEPTGLKRPLSDWGQGGSELALLKHAVNYTLGSPNGLNQRFVAACAWQMLMWQCKTCLRRKSLPKTSGVEGLKW